MREIKCNQCGERVPEERLKVNQGKSGRLGFTGFAGETAVDIAVELHGPDTVDLCRDCTAKLIVDAVYNTIQKKS